ncbi:MAG: MotA/TolQ/ExbB proton channel family protein [Alphaproteobacteria bacterium]|nr:MotA/TolQ/ExbB proton channel family protein [Alphaproteobacteria bacterium]MCY4319951.1 MotA/TolQ/ExbB proton channel family protein [Alphaproteobacteria bacterium]
MTRPTQYLVRMAVFVAVVVAATVLLFRPIVTAFMASPALNGLILGVLLIGIAYNFRHVLRLFREIAWIRSIQSPVSGRAAPLPAKPQLLATLATAFSSEAPVRFSAVSMRSILDGVAARIEEASETARYLAGLLIFLGLIGTFWGLIQTVSAIGDVIGGLEIAGGSLTGVFEELKSGLDAPLAGMGTAFSSSLFGLSGALVLGFLDLQASQASSRFVNELEEWLSSLTRLGGTGIGDGDQSVPTYIQALLETTAENLEDLRRIVGRAEEGRHSVNRNIEALSETLTALAEQLRDNQTAQIRLAEEQIETQTLLRRVLEGGQRERSGLDETTRRHIASLDSALSQMRDEVRTGRSELVEDLRNEIKLLARTVSARLEDRR